MTMNQNLPDSVPTMTNHRVYIVTGCTQGLGLHCVTALAANPAVGEVIFACRNKASAESTAASIIGTAKCAPGKLVVLSEPCDLQDNASVRKYAAAVLSYLGGRKVFALVNNAGIGGNPVWKKNGVGHESIFASNHLGHFLLTILLLPVITDRIVNVSSEVHDIDKKTTLPDPSIGWPQNDNEYEALLLQGTPFPDNSDRDNGARRYTRSKLCNVFFTQELALRLSGAVSSHLPHDVAAAAGKKAQKLSCTLPQARNIKVLAYNPGLMLDTQFITGAAGSALANVAWFLGKCGVLSLTPMGPLLRSGPLSGPRLAKLATGELLPNVTAGFVSDEEEIASSVFSRSEAGLRHQEELWAKSVKWAQVTPEELKAAGFKA